MPLATLTPDALLGRTLLGVAVVVLLTQALTPGLRRLGQPAVLAQVLAGILLGPVALGALPGNPAGWLFPPEVRSALGALGGVGLVLFLFLMGLDVDLPSVRAGGRRLAAVTAGSLLVPFALGVLAARSVLDGRAPAGVGTLPFALFVGTALSVSALPVLARILDERRLTRTPVGQLALASASLQDAAAWLLLAACLAIASASAGGALLAVAGLVALGLLLALVVRPVLAGQLGARLAAEGGGDGAAGEGDASGGRPAEGAGRDGGALGLLAAGLLACAALTQLTGLHAALGALAFGVAVPRSVLPRMRPALERVLGPVVRGVLLPVFFLVPGLGFTLTGLGGGSVGAILALLACAAGGKLVGAGLPALLTGAPLRAAAVLAVLLNARGLVELIVLDVALTNGLIDAGLYSELAVVALVTTLMTGPLLRALRPEEELHLAPAEPRARVAA